MFDDTHLGYSLYSNLLISNRIYYQSKNGSSDGLMAGLNVSESGYEVKLEVSSADLRGLGRTNLGYLTFGI